MKTLIIFNKDRYYELPITGKTTYQGIAIKLIGDTVYIEHQRIIAYQRIKTVLGYVLYVKDEVCCVHRKAVMFIGPHDAHIFIHASTERLILKENTLHISTQTLS